MYIEGISLEFQVLGTVLVDIAQVLILFADITNDEIDEVGLLASIPNMVSVFAIPLTGYAMDSLQNSGFMTTTQVSLNTSNILSQSLFGYPLTRH